MSFADAQRIVAEAVSPLGAEEVPLPEAAGRVLCADVVAEAMIPPLDCSARDGYAVRAADTRGATRSHPALLGVAGEIRAGGSPDGAMVTAGAAVRIMTGAPMPAGADAVVQFEDAEEDAGRVKVFCEAGRYENYRRAGESVRRGERVLARGERLRPADLGVLASLNHRAVRVFRRPTLAIVSTGDELAGPDEELGFGRIRDVNAYALWAEARQCGALPSCLGIARDTLAEVKSLFAKALAYDVIISTGGGAMGRYDFVREACAALGIEMLFERVNLRPGKTTAFGKKGGKLFFSLPGSPVAALTSFIQFVRPALLRLMGANRIAKPVVGAVLLDDIRKKPTSNLRLLPGRFSVIDNRLHVSTMGDRKPSIFQSMRDANCLIIVPENASRIAAGQTVSIQLLRHDEI